MSIVTHPVVVPSRVIAALLPGETALYDADTREWFGVTGDQRRALGLDGYPEGLMGPTDGEMSFTIDTSGPPAMKRYAEPDLRLPLQLPPLTRASANDLRSRIAAMSPGEHALLDDVRRFYERGGASS